MIGETELERINYEQLSIICLYICYLIYRICNRVLRMKILGNIFIAVGIYVIVSMIFLSSMDPILIDAILNGGLSLIGALSIFGGVILRRTV